MICSAGLLCLLPRTMLDRYRSFVVETPIPMFCVLASGMLSVGLGAVRPMLRRCGFLLITGTFRNTAQTGTYDCKLVFAAMRMYPVKQDNMLLPTHSWRPGAWR